MPLTPRRANASVADQALLVLAAIVWLGTGLDHPSIHNWDESAHQAVTRGTYASPLVPHIFEHDVYPLPPKEWMSAGVFLHKPTGPFWFGALAMHFVGFTPLALRLGSLLGELAAALSIYVLARRLAGPFLALAAGLAFLALPFGYQLTQGYLFGDATDCSLVGWVSVAMVLLLVSVERRMPACAAAAGFATGVGYLCKTALALAPAGVAMLFVVLGWRKWGPSLPLKSFGLFLAALLATAIPWNAYCAYAFPVEYQYEAHVTLAHLFTAEFAQWVRPADAILNEINEAELGPIPTALPLLALLWGAARSIHRREAATIALTLWVALSWVVLSVAKVKVPATAWGAVPGVIALLAVLFADALRFPALTGAVLGAVATPAALAAFPGLAQVPRSLPDALVETRTHPALLVGLLLAAAGATIALAIARATAALVSSRMPRWAIGLGTMAAFAGIYPLRSAQAEAAARESVNASVAPMRELGQAIDRVLPPGDALLFNRVDRDPPCCFLIQDLTFWSGKTNYRFEPDLAVAHKTGLHPYLVSVTSEPFAQVIGIPAFAAARVYDLEQPTGRALIPSDATPTAADGRDCHVRAWAVGHRDRDHDVWALYLENALPTFVLPLEFETSSGRMQVLATANDTYADPKHWLGHAWVEATIVGPRREAVTHLYLGGTTIF